MQHVVGFDPDRVPAHRPQRLLVVLGEAQGQFRANLSACARHGVHGVCLLFFEAFIVTAYR
jgi:hypothetical protein